MAQVRVRVLSLEFTLFQDGVSFAALFALAVDKSVYRLTGV
jgi:hypothetical protein